MKLGLGFHPRRVWQKKRRDRNIHRRQMRKKWYQRNKSKIRGKRRQRYKQLRKNPTWKRWQHKLRHEKTKRHMVGSQEPIIFGIPVGMKVWLGLLHSLDIGADVVRAMSLQSDQSVTIPLQIFVENAVFADPDHERDFWAVLEAVYGPDETA